MRLAGQAEDRCGGVRAVGLDSAQGAGGGLGERHCRRVRLILALLDRDAGRPVQPEFHVPQASAAASDRLRPPSAITPIIARSTAARARASDVRALAPDSASP